MACAAEFMEEAGRSGEVCRIRKEEEFTGVGAHMTQKRMAGSSASTTRYSYKNQTSRNAPKLIMLLLES